MIDSMTYYVHTSLWDFAEITTRLIAECLDDTADAAGLDLLSKFSIREARHLMEQFISECSRAYAEYEAKDAREALERARILLGQLHGYTANPTAKQALEGFIEQTKREWCQHNDHLAEVGQSKAGEINGYPACHDCYQNHLEQLLEDEEFERSYQPPHTLN